jgi:hypothetical protein
MEETLKNNETAQLGIGAVISKSYKEDMEFLNCMSGIDTMSFLNCMNTAGGTGGIDTIV